MKFGPVSVIGGTIIGVLTAAWIAGTILRWVVSVTSATGNGIILILVSIVIGLAGYSIARTGSRNPPGKATFKQGAQQEFHTPFSDDSHTDTDAEFDTMSEESESDSSETSYASRSIDGVGDGSDESETDPIADTSTEHQYDSETN